MIPIFVLELILAFSGLALLIITIATGAEGSYNKKVMFPFYGLYLVLVSWMVTFQNAEPRYEVTSTTTDLNETFKGTRKVQWFYNSHGNYAVIEGTYDDHSDYQVILNKSTELPRYGLNPDTILYTFDVDIKE